mmetsp:Transcript_19756/g.54884  ORF Transcript_19756/g.54884 Transcript_19756/m.54884 type:complete len:180 (+) Transcript_19756:746-1285(+)
MYFHIATQLNKETNAIPGGEKTAFAWVPFSDLLGAVAVASRRYFLGSAVKHRSMLGCPSKHDIQLHPCFATSLRLAMDAGLEAHLVRASSFHFSPQPGRRSFALSAQTLLAAPEASRCGAGGQGQAPEGGLRTAPEKRAKSRGRGGRKGSRASMMSPKHLMYWLQQDSVRSELTLAVPA